MDPIEHRLFSEVSTELAGEPRDSNQKFSLIANHKNSTGLTRHSLPGSPQLPCGLQSNARPAASWMRRHEPLPEWNYTIKLTVKIVLGAAP